MALNPQCHVIAVSGGKGGVGKSMFAANFAIALMAELRQKVLLIDLDAQSCGDQNVILGVRPQKTISRENVRRGKTSQVSVCLGKNLQPNWMTSLSSKDQSCHFLVRLKIT